MLQWLACIFGKHRVDRRHVLHDGQDFHGPCIGCGVRMRRSSERGIWEKARDEPAEADAG